MPTLGGDLDLVSLAVPADQPQLFQNAGNGVALVPASQSLDAALSQQASIVGVPEVRPVEAGLHLLVGGKISYGIDGGVAAIAGVRHARFSD